MARLMNLISRGIVEAVRQGPVMTALVSLLADELKDDVVVMQQVGFRSGIPAEAECVVVFPGGDRSHAIMVATDTEGPTVQPDECLVYGGPNQTARIRITPTGAIEITAAPGQPISLTTPSGTLNLTAANITMTTPGGGNITLNGLNFGAHRHPETGSITEGPVA